MVKFFLKKVNTKTTMHVCIIMYAVASLGQAHPEEPVPGYAVAVVSKASSSDRKSVV